MWFWTHWKPALSQPLSHSFGHIVGQKSQLSCTHTRSCSMWDVASLIASGKKQGKDHFWSYRHNPGQVWVLNQGRSSLPIVPCLRHHKVREQWQMLKLLVKEWNYLVYCIPYFTLGPSMLGSVILRVVISTPWQACFSPLGTFALCDGDFSRWDFYSGPRHGGVTAGRDTSRNARPSGWTGFWVSVFLLCWCCLGWQ